MQDENDPLQCDDALFVRLNHAPITTMNRPSSQERTEKGARHALAYLTETAMHQSNLSSEVGDYSLEDVEDIVRHSDGTIQVREYNYRVYQDILNPQTTNSHSTALFRALLSWHRSRCSLPVETALGGGEMANGRNSPVTCTPNCINGTVPLSLSSELIAWREGFSGRKEVVYTLPSELSLGYITASKACMYWLKVVCPCWFRTVEVTVGNSLAKST